jgi:hypothetical protein
LLALGPIPFGIDRLSVLTCSLGARGSTKLWASRSGGGGGGGGASWAQLAALLGPGLTIEPMQRGRCLREADCIGTIPPADADADADAGQHDCVCYAAAATTTAEEE